MPIEIRQMIVKARIDTKAASAPAAAPSAKDDCDCGAGISADDLARLLRDREER